LKLSTRSKAERGYRLASAQKGANAEPEKARAAWVTRKNSCAEAFSAILEAATKQILVNREAVLETDDPEGAHQLRIGLRRLRNALRALRPLVDSGSLRAFDLSARSLGRSVGMLRDADVMISGIVAPVEAVASRKNGFAKIHTALVRDRQDKRDEVRAALRSPVWTRLQLYLTLWPRTLEECAPGERPITKYARKVLRRKSLKNLRYQTEFFAPLFEPRDTRHFIKRLKTLQDVFGYINDVRMAPRLLEVEKQRNAGIDAARAAAYTIGRHEAEAAHVWLEAPKAWKDLERSPRFWD